MDRASFTGLMCRVWEHVTPVSHGLNRPEQMAEGMASFAAARGLTLTPGLFVFPSARTKRPPYEQAEALSAAPWSGTALWPSSTSTTAG